MCRFCGLCCVDTAGLSTYVGTKVSQVRKVGVYVSMSVCPRQRLRMGVSPVYVFSTAEALVDIALEVRTTCHKLLPLT
jgi:hypothetical protein